MTKASVPVTREQVVAYRRRATALDERLPAGPDSLRRAAWAGLTDSVPRGGLHSIHARVHGTTPSTWEDDSLVQVWGLRFSAYLVAAQDRAVFTVGRTSADPARRQLGEDLADRLEAALEGARVPVPEASRAIGAGHPSQLRYAAPTGRLLIRWDGARQPHLWIVPRPDMDVYDARLELARRFLHSLGPSTEENFGDWAGIRARTVATTFEALKPELVPVTTPVGEAWILAEDEATLREPAGPPAPARLPPSGDTFFLLWGTQRDLLVPDAVRRDQLWTPRVWPGAVLVDGDVVGVWRRAQHVVTVQPWTTLTRSQVAAVEAEAASLPVPGVERDVVVRWD